MFSQRSEQGAKVFYCLLWTVVTTFVDRSLARQIDVIAGLGQIELAGVRKISQKIQLIVNQRLTSKKWMMSSAGDVVLNISPANWVFVTGMFQWESALWLFSHPLSQLRSMIRSGMIKRKL